MRRLLLASFALLLACETEPSPVFLEYCVPMGSEDGVPEVGVVLDYGDLDSAPSSSDPRVLRFAVSTESPLTMVTGEAGYVTRSLVVVDRYSANTVAARLAFPQIDVLQVPSPSLPFGPQDVDGVLGGDMLRRFAVRLRYGSDPDCTFDWTPGVRWPSITFLREVPDDDDALASDGFAVFRFTLAGGGTMVVDGAEYVLRASRVGLWLCLNPARFDPDDPPEPVDGHYPVTGVDAYALVATGTSPVVMTMGLAERLSADGSVVTEGRTFHVRDEDVDGATVHGITTIAVVGSVDEGLSPCAELAKRYALEHERHHPGARLYPADLEGPHAPVVVLDVADATEPEFDAVALSEESTFWTSLWGETVPDVAMYDLYLPSTVLSHLETIIDYPQRRVIMRCAQYVPPSGSCSGDSPCCTPGGACAVTRPCMQLP